MGETIDPMAAIGEVSELDPISVNDSISHAIQWRSILVALAQDPTSEEIWAFLCDVHNKPGIDYLEDAIGGPMRELDEAVQVVNGESVPDPRDPLFATFIGGVAEIASGNRDAVELAVRELSAKPQPVANQYAELILALLHRMDAALPCRKGIQLRDSISSLPKGIAGREQYQVLARMSSFPGPGHRFFEIFALIHDGCIYRLSHDEATMMFPHRGTAILFAGKTGQLMPTGSEWALTLKLIDGAHDQTARYEVASVERRLCEVISIDHGATAPDKVRNAIASYKVRPGISTVFELDDGILIPTLGFPPNFDEPLGYLETLVAYRLDGRRLVVDSVDEVDGFIDCSPPEIAIKRLFKARSNLGELPIITKAQVAKLADLAAQESNGNGFIGGVKRAKSHVDELLATKEDVSLVVQELLETPEVAKTLADEKHRLLSAFEASLENRRKEIESLSTRKKQIETEIKKLLEQQEAQASRLGDQLHDAFEKAAGDGLKILSSVALLSPFLRGKPEKTKRDVVGTMKVSGSLVRDTSDILKGVIGFSRKYGLPQNVLCQAFASIMTNGLVGLAGRAAPQFQQAIAASLTGNIWATVSLSSDMFGWGDVLGAPVVLSLPDCPAMSLGEFIALAQRSKVPAYVSIIGANRIPPESYMEELLSIAGFGGIGNAISWRRFDGQLFTARLTLPVFFSLSFVYGKSTFQVSSHLSAGLPFINCDADWGQRPSCDSGVHVGAMYVEEPDHIYRAIGNPLPNIEDVATAYMKAWAVPDGDAQMLARLSHHIGRASRETLESEVGRIQGGVVERYLAYVRHEGNEQISEIYSTDGKVDK
jgi:hypothetical protein